MSGWVGDDDKAECPMCGEVFDTKTEGVDGDDGTPYCSLTCLNEDVVNDGE